MNTTLRQILRFQMPALALLAGASILTSACESKDEFTVSASGSIRVIWKGAPDAAKPQHEIKALYGKLDPLKPLELAVSRPVEKDQVVPVGVRNKGEVLTLQAIEITNGAGRSLYRLARPELDPIRMRSIAPQQSLIELESAGGEDLLSAKISLPTEAFWELPAKSTGLPLKSLMPVLLDFFRLEDTSDSLLKLRWASAATEDFHDELMKLMTVAPAIDLSRLELILDGFYFPSTFIEDMRKRERTLTESESPEDRAKAEILRKNIELAEAYSETSNRLIIAGLVRIKSMNFEMGETLLRRLFAGKEATDIAFLELINKLGGSFEALLDQEKVRLLDLAIKKKALEFAASLALEMFTKGQDKSIGALIDLLRRFPPSAARDKLSQATTLVEGEVSVAEVAALLTPLQSREILLQLSEILLAKVKDLTSQQVIILTEQRIPDETRDTLLLMALRQTVKFDNDSLRALLLMATNWTVRGQMCALVLPKIAPLQGKSFAQLIQVLPADPQRDEILFQGLALMSSLSPVDYGSLAQLLVAEKAFWDFLESATPRLTPFRMVEAIATSDLLLARPAPYRDAFLIKAAEGIVDLSWENLGELLVRASSDDIRTKIQEIARKRLQ